MKKYGYVRVSSRNQNVARQVEGIKIAMEKGTQFGGRRLVTASYSIDIYCPFSTKTPVLSKKVEGFSSHMNLLLSKNNRFLGLKWGKIFGL